MRNVLVQRVACAALSLIALSSVRAQAPSAPSAVEEFAKVAADYYIPADRGLKNFRCELRLEVKPGPDGQSTPDEKAALEALQHVRMTVGDDLQAGGNLAWQATTPMPANLLNRAGRLRENYTQIWTNFLKTWNNFALGDPYRHSDPKTLVERTPTGFHLSRSDAESLLEADYEGTRATLIHLKAEGIEIRILPEFQDSPKGRLLHVLRTQLLAGGETHDFNQTISYAPAGEYLLPSAVTFEISGDGTIPFTLSNCHANGGSGAPLPANGH